MTIVDASEIAGRLTKAQREALLLYDAEKIGTLFPPELVEAGYQLLDMRLFGARPTPLGLAVRALLQERSK